jgi:hypothetical protein
MTADTLRTARSPRTLRTGVVLAVLLAAIDVVGMFAIGLPNAPIAVNIITSVLAAATLVGAIWAYRGAAWGVWVVAISRALSALSLLPLLIVPEAPKEAIPMSVVVMVLSAVAIVLLFVGRAKRR